MSLAERCKSKEPDCDVASFIPFNAITRVGTEFTYIQQAFEEMHISGDGIFSRKCHSLLEDILGVQRALLTTSCTHALEMAALLLNIKPGDEVILPSFTFVSTANAFVLRGAKPLFLDIRPDTLNLNETLLENAISPATRAIVTVHYAGVGCEMDPILQIARKYEIPVVEDNAHGLFGRYRGKYLGSFGTFATQSFHETKNFSCGEGGALLINAKEYIERAEILREKGTDRSRFFRGQVDKYSWVDVGSSYLLSDILAAILFAQLQKRDVIQSTRCAIWNRYKSGLAVWAAEHGIQLPFVPSYCEQAYHMFYLILPDSAARTQLIQHLKARNILSLFHYVPLHLSQMGRKFGGFPGQCPVTEHVSERLLRLPMYSALSESDQERILDGIREFRPAGTKVFTAKAG